MFDAVISVREVEKYFPTVRPGWKSFLQPFSAPTEPALRGVSFDALRGESVALVGPNGAGKSTLLRILATLLLPTRGNALIGNLDTRKDAKGVRKQIGYHTGGDEGFYLRLTGRENLLFFAAMNNIMGRTATERIACVADWLGILTELDRPVRTLSTGITHRLGLARALLHHPSVLLLDEPTRSLDPLAAADFRRLLKKEMVGRLGATLLFASHSLAEVEEMADRILVLDRGKIVAAGATREIEASTETESLEAALCQLLRHSPLRVGRQI
jgi:ABC-2 type transport system ATP-binding protein